jgi:hypothetical protein
MLEEKKNRFVFTETNHIFTVCCVLRARRRVIWQGVTVTRVVPVHIVWVVCLVTFPAMKTSGTL